MNISKGSFPKEIHNMKGKAADIVYRRYQSLTLKPCPFCGSRAIISAEGFDNYYIGCSGEGCIVMPFLFGDVNDIDRMITDWNKREEIE